MGIQKKFHAAILRKKSNASEDPGLRCTDVANERMNYIILQLLTGCLSWTLVNRQNRVSFLESMLPFDLSVPFSLFRTSFGAGAICA
jgi:hypothetical protein